MISSIFFGKALLERILLLVSASRGGGRDCAISQSRDSGEGCS